MKLKSYDWKKKIYCKNKQRLLPLCRWKTAIFRRDWREKQSRLKKKLPLLYYKSFKELIIKRGGRKRVGRGQWQQACPRVPRPFFSFGSNRDEGEGEMDGSRTRRPHSILSRPPPCRWHAVFSASSRVEPAVDEDYSSAQGGLPLISQPLWAIEATASRAAPALESAAPGVH